MKLSAIVGIFIICKCFKGLVLACFELIMSLLAKEMICLKG